MSCCVDFGRCWMGTWGYIAAISGGFLLLACILCLANVTELQYVGDLQNGFSFTGFTYFFQAAVFIGWGVIAASIGTMRYRDVAMCLWVFFFVLCGLMFISTIYEIVTILRLFCLLNEMIEAQTEGMSAAQKQLVKSRITAQIPSRYYIFVVAKFIWIGVQVSMFVVGAVSMAKGKKERLEPDCEEEVVLCSGTGGQNTAVVINMGQPQPQPVVQPQVCQTTTTTTETYVQPPPPTPVYQQPYPTPYQLPPAQNAYQQGPLTQGFQQPQTQQPEGQAQSQGYQNQPVGYSVV